MDDGKQEKVDGELRVPAWMDHSECIKSNLEYRDDDEPLRVFFVIDDPAFEPFKRRLHNPYGSATPERVGVIVHGVYRDVHVIYPEDLPSVIQDATMAIGDAEDDRGDKERIRQLRDNLRETKDVLEERS
jgi:hypothetical protein